MGSPLGAEAMSALKNVGNVHGATVITVTTYGNSPLCLPPLILSFRLPKLEVAKRKRAFARKTSLEVSIMKLSTIIVVAALAIPAASSFAQSQPVTRAEVKAQLAQLEQDGYHPGTGRTTYPTQIQAAEAKVAAQNGQSSYGGVSDGSVASGGFRAPAHTGNGVESLYSHH
jgi:Domain of unknown function (DUF4148)